MQGGSSRFVVIGLLLASLAGCDARKPPMPEKWVAAPKPRHEKQPLPEPSHDAVGDADGSLLASYAGRKTTPLDKRMEWSLPTNAKTLIVELLIAAAHDDVDEVREVLTAEARFGMPDRRELQGRPIYDSEDPLGVEFLTEFRAAASRFKKRAGFNCRPLQPGWEVLASTGAEPMWCTYTSDDGFDLLVFRLVTDAGQPKVDYVGYMRERPSDFVRVANVGDPPPTTPWMRTAEMLEAPELMPDGTNPVLEAPKRPPPPVDPKPTREPEPPAKPVEAVEPSAPNE